MRVYISADSGPQPQFHLPWDYHLSFQAFIYDALEVHEPDLASELHDAPHAPPFSYSEFIQTGPYQAEETGISCDSGYWVVNSGDARIIDSVANHAKANELTLGHTQIPVDGVEMEQIEAEQRARYRTVSPIFVSRHRDNNRVALHPDDPMWGVELRDGIQARMDAMGYDTEHFEFDLEQVHSWKEDSMRVNSDHSRSCTYGEFTLRSDPATSRFIQRQGLGEGSGMGMSCVMPVSHIPDSKRKG